MDFRRNLEQLRDAVTRRHRELVILSVPPPASSRTRTVRLPRPVASTISLSASG